MSGKEEMSNEYGGGYTNWASQQQNQSMAGVQITQPTVQHITVAPPDYFLLAVFATLCCVWPIGVVALKSAREARTAVENGDLVTATVKAKEAKKWSLASIVIGIPLVAAIATAMYFVIKNNNDNHY
ncbi:hypothetical protein SNE40_012928 [Patella caerulea]|uniref:Uncharacterized protein n=1 Tax=Patella caerulea TaxID=87958 RepID=A0AAN8JLA2_PATCE